MRTSRAENTAKASEKRPVLTVSIRVDENGQVVERAARGPEPAGLSPLALDGLLALAAWQLKRLDAARGPAA